MATIWSICRCSEAFIRADQERIAVPRQQEPHHNQALSAWDRQADARPRQGGRLTRWFWATGPNVAQFQHDLGDGLGHVMRPNAKGPEVSPGAFLIAISDQAALAIEIRFCVSRSRCWRVSLSTMPGIRKASTSTQIPKASSSKIPT